MCGRIAPYAEPDNHARIVGAGMESEALEHWRPRFNIAPRRQILGVSER